MRLAHHFQGKSRVEVLREVLGWFSDPKDDEAGFKTYGVHANSRLSLDDVTFNLTPQELAQMTL